MFKKSCVCAKSHEADNRHQLNQIPTDVTGFWKKKLRNKLINSSVCVLDGGRGKMNQFSSRESWSYFEARRHAASYDSFISLALKLFVRWSEFNKNWTQFNYPRYDFVSRAFCWKITFAKRRASFSDQSAATSEACFSLSDLLGLLLKKLVFVIFS